MRILQLGCNDAKDKLFDFIKDNTTAVDFVLLVDANPYALEVAKNRYEVILPPKKFKIIHGAVVVDSATQVNLYIPNKDKCSGHSSIFKDLTALNWGEDLSVLTVNAHTVSYYLDIIGSPLDQLHIDVEGLDADIILDIDLEKYKINSIVFEAAHTDGYFKKGDKFDKCIHKLIHNGYKLQYVDDLDIRAYK